MEHNSPKDSDNNNANPSQSRSQETLPSQMKNLSLSEENIGLKKESLPRGETNQSDLRQEQNQQREERQEESKPNVSEDESSRTYRINKFTLRRDSDNPDEEEEQESSNLRPEDLYDIVLNFDTPREVDLKVKIKGDFNVTLLA
ncbi:hypothetical protein BJY04DRAFT_140914 [Aspergillus karnatakaensis]|uniref:uncharacterized protein n=1 Tax=Aspergillus karnatakaensis TaxID=1810916 RepID=UPI003CCDB81F